MTSFRDSINRITPRWLRRQWGERFMYSIGAALDALADQVMLGVKERFPSTAGSDALPYLAQDRRITRGFAESDDSFRARLVTWLDDWRIAGSALSVLRQVRGYLTPTATTLRIVTNASTWYTLGPDGSFSVRKGTANWDWDGHPERWWRYWLIVYSDAGPWDPEDALGSGHALGEAGRTIGTTATAEQVATLRMLCSRWQGAHAYPPWIIVAFDPASFDPVAAPGSPGMPDGTWGPWGKYDLDGIKRPSRLDTARYVDGP